MLLLLKCSLSVDMLLFIAGGGFLVLFFQPFENALFWAFILLFNGLLLSWFDPLGDGVDLLKNKFDEYLLDDK